MDRVPGLFLRAGSLFAGVRPLLKATQPRDELGRWLPMSGHITSLGQARDWWKEHLGGKVLQLKVHSRDPKKLPIKIKVRFDPNSDHAFTDDIGGKQKTGQRVFDAKRAQAMSRIPQVIEHPKARARNYHADLLFEAPVNGEQYTVVLTWHDAAGLYEFRSAHFKPAADVRMLLAQQDRQKNKGPLQKGGPLTVFAGLRDAQRQGSPSGGYHPIGTGNGLHGAIVSSTSGYRNNGTDPIPLLFFFRSAGKGR